MAIALEAGTSDYRENLAVVALLHNSARKLSDAPEMLFKTAAQLTGPRGAELLLGFLQRAPEARSIETFGFREGEGPMGFDYIPLLPEYGGPSPLKSDPR